MASGTIPNMFDDLLKVFTFTFDSASISAGSYYNFTANNTSSLPSGYSVIAVRTITTGVTAAVVRGFNAAGGIVMLWNASSSAVTASPSMQVILARDSAF